MMGSRDLDHTTDTLGWFEWVVNRWEDEWIRGPRNEAELNKCMARYAHCGLPGVVCSQDGVHIPWDRAPSQEKNNYVGKEGFATVAYNVTVTHNRWICHMHGPFGGNRNDKTLVQDDVFIASVSAYVYIYVCLYCRINL